MFRGHECIHFTSVLVRDAHSDPVGTDGDYVNVLVEKLIAAMGVSHGKEH